MRVLTLVCFFHFSGLNNGFTFFAASPSQTQSLNFAPVAIQSIVFGINPFHWKRALTGRAFLNSIFASHRVLKIASYRVLRETFIQWSQVKEETSFCSRLACARSNNNISLNLRAKSREAGRSREVIKFLTANPQTLDPRPDFSKESWLKLEKLDFLDLDYDLKVFSQPALPGGNARDPIENIEHRLKAQALNLLQASRPKHRQIIHYDLDDSGGKISRLNFRGSK